MAVAVKKFSKNDLSYTCTLIFTPNYLTVGSRNFSLATISQTFLRERFCVDVTACRSQHDGFGVDVSACTGFGADRRLAVLKNARLRKNKVGCS